MTIVTRFRVAFVLITAALPFVVAQPGQTDQSSCKGGEFWYKQKNCCLPLGGPPSHPEPPPEKNCPPAGWSWSKEHSCCVPHQPLPPSHAPPQCPKEWDWFPATFCCQKSPRYLLPRPSGGGSDHDRKRASHMSHFEFCPMDLTACPITSASGPSGDFECLDTNNELESCGGCASIGQGQDCAAIKGAWNVGCEQGTCAVYTCIAGFRPSRDGKSCIAF